MKIVEDAVRELVGVWPSDDVEAVYLYKIANRHIAGLPDGTAPCICTRTEFEECTRRLRNEPSWKDAPDWAVAKAQDSTGWWYWYSENPSELPGMPSVWVYDNTSGRCSRATQGEVIGDWSETLRLRPEEKKVESKDQWYKRGEYPPVGTVCEMTHPGLSGWLTVEILLYRDSALAPSGKTVVVCAESEEEWPMGVAAININTKLDFRPLKTERERWVAAAQKVIGCEPNAHRHMLGQLYDAALAKMPEGEGDENS